MADQSVLTVSIVTPDGEVYNQSKATMVVVKTKSGQLGIMPNHVPVIASLAVDAVLIKTNHHQDKVAVNGGFVEFSNNEATVIANSAEKQGDIDVARAKRAQARAKAAIQKAKQAHDQVTLEKEQVALMRAVNRIRVAKK